MAKAAAAKAKAKKKKKQARARSGAGSGVGSGKNEEEEENDDNSDDSPLHRELVKADYPSWMLLVPPHGDDAGPVLDILQVSYVD